MTSTAGKRVGIYRTVYPLPSEAFITEQASHLRTYAPFFLLRDRKGPLAFEHDAISDRDPSGLKRKLFTITRSPRFFEMPAIRRLDLIHAHFAQDGVYAAALAQASRIPLIVTCHGADVAQSTGAMLRSKRPTIYQYLLHKRELVRTASKFVAVSRFISSMLVEAGIPRAKIVQHYIGVDTERFAPAADPSAERYILCVGRHVAKKGIKTLLRAFARVTRKHPAVRMVQVGAGPQTGELEELVRKLGIQKQTRMLGAIPHQRVTALMRQAEVFALTSETADDGDVEALGIVFNEASACGVPVVSTFSGGIPEAVRHGETGLLAAEKDESRVAEHLDALLSDREQARAMGRRGREFVLERFDIRKQTSELERIYAELVP